MAFGPLLEARWAGERVEVSGDPVIAPIGEAADPLARLEELFSQTRLVADPTPPFCGGWVGYWAHEAAAWILQTPATGARPPARPSSPLAFFRFYAGALVFDHRENTQLLIVNEFDGGRQGAIGPPSLAQAQELLTAFDPRAPPVAAAHARDAPHATMDPETYRERIATLQRLVRNGDCFQANLTVSTAFPWDHTPEPEALLSLYEEYAAANPGAWGGYFSTPEMTLLSSSPELLARTDEARLRLRPIAGTRPRGPTLAEDDALAQELRDDEKERAEHAMLVDLARNDAAAVCRPGTVWVPNFAGVERYRHVMHLVSEVQGELAPGWSPLSVIRSVFPGGTVTGAPKRRAVQRIAELEGSPRGPYTGALGYVSLNGSTQWNLLIRTLTATPSHLVAHAGCGIVEGSRPDREAEELLAKARAQVEAALGQARPAPAWLRCGQVEPGPAWRPRTVQGPVPGRRVLLVDFDDSFVHNLADGLAALGARTTVLSAHAEPREGWREPPTHLVLSPGPGWPGEFPAWRAHLAEADRRGTPVLGVCLGHQAMAEHAGARVVRHPVTVHGKASQLRKTPAGRRDPLVGGWTGRWGGRYHSLVATDLPASMQALVQLEDGTCMAARHLGRPWWGLQFHPESLLTEDGLSLLQSFLEVNADFRG